MTWVMRILATNTIAEFVVPVYLCRCDVDAYDGRGDAEWTTDVHQALRFASPADVMIFWRQTSTVRPLRPDGLPNRPLTACTVSVEPYDPDAPTPIEYYPMHGY